MDLHLESDTAVALQRRSSNSFLFDASLVGAQRKQFQFLAFVPGQKRGVIHAGEIVLGNPLPALIPQTAGVASPEIVMAAIDVG